MQEGNHGSKMKGPVKVSILTGRFFTFTSERNEIFFFNDSCTFPAVDVLFDKETQINEHTRADDGGPEH